MLESHKTPLGTLRAVRIPIGLLLLAAILIPVAATRAGLVTADTETYLSVYGDYLPSDGLLGGHFAPLFTAIGWVGKNLRLDENGYLWLVAILGVTLKLIGIRRSSQFFLAAVLVYLSKYYLLHELVQLRAGIAAAIFLCAIPMLARRKIVGYAMAIMVAGAFHTSAFIYLLLYPLCMEVRNKHMPLVWIILAAGVISILNAQGAVFSMISSFFPKVNVYVELLAEGQYTEIHLFNAEMLIKLTIWCILAVKQDELRREFMYFDVLFRVWTLSIVSYFALSSVPVFAFRLSELFDVVSIALFPALLIAFRTRLIGLTAFGLVILAFGFNFYFIQPIVL